MIDIIAEIGVNHDGSLDKAFKLIQKAKIAGATYVKFQIYNTENLVSKSLSLASYQKRNIGSKFETMFEMLKKYELKYEDFIRIKKYCQKEKIKFLASTFDEESLLFYYKNLNNSEIKIPSGEITNINLLKKISKLYKTIILSTGASNLKEIITAYKILKNRNNKVTVLHCNSSYPTRYENILLLNILELKKKIKCDIGLSDHTLGNEVALASIALGINCIEKHITLNVNSSGPDHSSSINPSQFSDMVSKIRNIEKSLKYNQSFVSSSEKQNLKFIRKSIYAKTNIRKGEKFNEANLICKRPDVGISANNYFKLIGKKSKFNFVKDELIKN